MDLVSAGLLEPIPLGYQTQQHLKFHFFSNIFDKLTPAVSLSCLLSSMSPSDLIQQRPDVSRVVKRGKPLRNSPTGRHLGTSSLLRLHDRGWEESSLSWIIPASKLAHFSIALTSIKKNKSGNSILSRIPLNHVGPGALRLSWNKSD